ncbi:MULTISPECIES: universal stress protein [Actinomadura]|jgi:nucleotide-binding universal stress UspA family protein|uniref:Nucleotide-binding universal stress UspA family protein n=1 Tax=Actinomadura citrea TaxID=46158 RepID=A0A7Y9GD06_9ACTN|nr:universal stress protein [Actinomadura citrea]NYE14277.1 nucleotide-binding universal stress UspA family protein [Actinomadura citrea]GGT79790.1 universal stress protein [Actinomadura citrea]
MSAYRIILVGTDGSDSSFRAVDKAAQLAAATGATLLLASAYSPMPERERANAADRLGDLAYKVQGSTPADDALRAARERAVAAGATDIEQEAVEGDAVDVLSKLAKERPVDLMVIGNRGLNSLAGRILGSVPANLSHRASCDVLIVHTTPRGK